MNPLPLTTAIEISENSSSSSKIPFRPRKIRKISSKHPILATTSPPSNPLLLPKIAKQLSSKSEIDLAINHLRDSDPLLASIIEAHRPPTFESNNPPFLSLARSILYQQLATKAANSIYTRFLALFSGEESGVLPDAVLSLTPPQLRKAGVPARKASYLHDLADRYVKGALSDSSILEMNDEELLTGLTAVKGIGAWSVHMFMIFSLRRPDVLPVGDLGVRKGVKLLYGLKELPGPLLMEQICEVWRPYRSVGSWYMWRLVEANKAAGATK